MKLPHIKDFLSSHRTAKPNEVVDIPVGDKCLRVTYDGEGLIHHIARVDNGNPKGRQLYLNFKSKGFTFVREGGMTGEYWSDGKSGMAAHFEDIDPTPIKEISFEDWIDESLNAMLKEKD